jgi:hypothetical protein
LQDRVEVFFGDQSAAVETERAAMGAGSVQGWYTGTIVDIARQLVESKKRKQADTIFTVKFDDGEVRRDINPRGSWCVRHAVVVDASATSHTPLEYKCQISFFERLDDPARGVNCTHPPCFNYSKLSQFVSARKRCPHTMCDAPLAATRQIRRDEWLRQELSALPADTQVGTVLYVRHGVEVLTQPPGGRRGGDKKVIDLGESPPAKQARQMLPPHMLPPAHVEDMPAQLPPTQTPAAQAMLDNQIVLSDDDDDDEASQAPAGTGQSREEAIEL